LHVSRGDSRICVCAHGVVVVAASIVPGLLLLRAGDLE
jgi:hypothetical protein